MISKRENILKFYHHECPDYIPDLRRDINSVPYSFGKFESPPPPGQNGKDGYGVYHVFETTSRAFMPMPDPETGKYVMDLDDIENWRDFVKFPDPEAFDWAAHVEEDMKNVDCENKLVSASLGHGMFERLHSLMGMENGAMALAAYPDEVLDFFNALADYKCATIRKIAQYYPKVDMIDLSDDWGHQEAAFFSEDTWNELFRPGMTKIMDTCREVGLMFQLHSCGRWEKILPHAIDAGLDHWTSCQCVNDIDGILKTYGRRLTMIGGCDPKAIQEPGMTLEKMRAIVADRIDKVCRGGCVIPFGNSSTPLFRQAVEMEVALRDDFYQKPENREVPV